MHFSTLKRGTVEKFNENLFKNNLSKNIVNVAFRKLRLGKLQPRVKIESIV